MRVQRYTDKSIYVQHFYIKNNTEHKKRKYIIKKIVNMYIFSIGMNYEGIGLSVERLFTSRNGIVFFGLNKTTRTTFNL